MNFYISISKNKKFVFYSIIILIIFLVSYITFLEIFTRKYILSDLRPQTKELVKNGKSFKVVLFGTSHTNYGNLMEQKSKSFFNYGESYTYPKIMYSKMKLLTKHAPNVKYLLLEADTHQFYYFSMNNPTGSTKFYRELKMMDDFKFSLKRLFFSYDNEIKPILHKRILEKYFIRSNKKIEKGNEPISFLWEQLSYDERVKKVKSRQNMFGFSKANVTLNKESIAIFEKTIQYAQENNITVILIRHPMAIEYLDLMETKVRNDVNEFLDMISKKYKLKVLNYQYIYKDHDNFFMNQDHLNLLGVTEFSKTLYTDLKNNKILD